MVTEGGPLGATFNIGGVMVPVDVAAGGDQTGLRVYMRNHIWCSFLIIQNTDGGTTDDLQADLQEHNASTGGTSQDLDIITEFHTQSETTIDGDETWTTTTQSVASEIAAIAGSAELEIILVFSVHQDQLSDGFDWVSCNIPDLGSTDTQFTAVIPILTGLQVQRKPANLAATQ